MKVADLRIVGVPWLVIALTAAVNIEAAIGQQTQAANRLVRVVTISQERIGEGQGTARLESTITRLDRAASFTPDIVCLPETFTGGAAEPIPGPTTDRLSRWASEHHCWVICPLLTKTDGRVFNSAILINRSGQIRGRYDKIHPTENELASEICPGNTDPPVFQTDFGTIGIQICFDVNWRQQWRSLKEKGADIIFFPSAFPAARQVRSLAWLNQCFVATATQARSATIYDINGDPLSTTGQYRQWAGAVLPLGKRLFEIDFHVSKMRAIEQKYGDKVEVSWFHDDDLVTLASVDRELTVKDLIVEFDLTPHQAYIQRAQNAQDAKRVEREP